jgi:outer membrane protein assembly factor BamD (BamD/ComL family)
MINANHLQANAASRRANTAMLSCLMAICLGCQSVGPFGKDNSDLAGATNPWSSSKPPGDVTLAGGPGANPESEQDVGTRLVNFVTGKTQDTVKGKELYQQGDAVFRSASKKSKKDAVDDYVQASKFFHKAGNAAPGSALEQDALFMKAESLFFANRLTDATKAYEKLQKDFPRNRHNDRVAARLFAISRYWIDAARAGDASWFKLNLTNSKLPAYDAKGHAIRVLDQIRYDDPTGRLADDATMAAAAEYIRQENFELADEFLTDLRETFTDSDHMFLAHVLGIRCKLELYAGPMYSGLVLDEAEDLIRKTRTRFPDKLKDQKYSDLLARSASEIAYHQAERFAQRAQYRENRREYRAARDEYRRLLAKCPDTPQAGEARKRLAQIEQLPSVPPQRLAWLAELLPDSRASAPLETVETLREDAQDAVPAEPTGGTILR